MGECQLDDLLDMLNDDEDEATFAEAEAAALASQDVPNAPKSQNNSARSSSGGPAGSPRWVAEGVVAPYQAQLAACPLNILSLS